MKLQPDGSSSELLFNVISVLWTVFFDVYHWRDKMDTESRRQKTNAWFSSPPAPHVFGTTPMTTDPRVTSAQKLWVFLRISTTVVDTGTPSFQTVTTTIVTAALGG